MKSYIVTVIHAATHVLQLQTIMEATSEGHLLSILNAKYPRFKVYQTGDKPDYRIYITLSSK